MPKCSERTTHGGLLLLALMFLSPSVSAQDAEALPTAEDEPIGVDRLLALTDAVGGETPVWSPDGRRLLFASGFTGGLATVPAEGGHPRRVPIDIGGAGHFLASQSPRWSPDGRWISYITDKSGSPEIWVWSVHSGEEFRLTGAGARLISSYAWSPDGESIAFSADRHGDMDVWRVSVPDGRMRRLTTSELYQAYPSWTPDGRHLLYVELDRSWTDHTVIEIPADGGESRVVLRDWDFFDYGGGAEFGHPLPSPDGEKVLIRSHRSGWINYWIVPREGGEALPVAPDSADQSHVRWSPDGSRVVFVTNRNGTQSLTVADVSEGTSRTVVAPGAVGPERLGVLDNPEWSPDGERISFTYQSPTRPRELHVVEVATGEARTLVPSTPEGGLLQRLVAPEKVTYESTDGLTIHAYLYAPEDRSAERPLPGLLWIHGGPTSQWRDTFHPHVQYFVARGYVILMPNIRGSSGYGKAFEDANNRCWSHCDLEDVVAGAEYLRKLPYVDGTSLGITGTSYGGIMTLSAIVFAPGEFQAAVSQSGYADWVAFMENDNELRHRKLLEYELGPWPESRDVYRHVSSIRAAEDVRTPAFLVHGKGRYPGSPQSQMFAGALQEHYKVFRYRTYPGETYYVAGRENRRQLLLDMEMFLDHYLKGKTVPLPGRGHVPTSDR